MRRSVLATVLVLVSASGAAAANLVTNGQFNQSFTGWTRSGATETHNGGDFGMPGSPQGQPFAGKISSWGGIGDAGSITQTITLTGDGTLTCELYAGAKMTDGSTGRYALVQVVWNGTVVAQINEPSGNYNATDRAWQSFTAPVTGTGANTLVVQWVPHSAEWTWMGVDNISVESAGCTNETAITAAALDVATAPGNRVLTVTGQNLDLVTTAQLKQGDTVIDGVIRTPKTSGQIVVDFTLPLIPLGAYDVVLTRPVDGICPATITQYGGVTIACSLLDATVTESKYVLQSTTVDQDQSIVLTGTHIGPALASVSLRKTRGTLVTIAMKSLQAVNDNNVQVTFDLKDAEAGRYDLLYTWNTCAAASPAEHDGAVLVYVNALTNGSFEEGCMTPDPKTVLCPTNEPPNNPAPKHWDGTCVGSHWGGGVLVRDGYNQAPTCLPDGTIENITGAHYAGMELAAQWQNTVTIFQTIAAPNVDGNGNTTAAYNIRAEFAMNGDRINGSDPYEPNPITAKIRLLDGDENGTALAETTIPGRDEQTIVRNLVADPDYNAIIPAGTHFGSSPRTLTIEFQFTKIDTPHHHYNGFWIDNVRNGPFIPFGCNDTIWADVNFDDSVDMIDFGVLQECLTTGVIGPQTLTFPCVCLDRDQNSMIGEPDMTEFIKCVSGPQVPWSPDVAPNCVR